MHRAHRAGESPSLPLTQPFSGSLSPFPVFCPEQKRENHPLNTHSVKTLVFLHTSHHPAGSASPKLPSCF